MRKVEVGVGDILYLYPDRNTKPFDLDVVTFSGFAPVPTTVVSAVTRGSTGLTVCMFGLRYNGRAGSVTAWLRFSARLTSVTTPDGEVLACFRAYETMTVTRNTPSPEELEKCTQPRGRKFRATKPILLFLTERDAASWGLAQVQSDLRDLRTAMSYKNSMLVKLTLLTAGGPIKKESNEG